MAVNMELSMSTRAFFQLVAVVLLAMATVQLPTKWVGEKTFCLSGCSHSNVRLFDYRNSLDATVSVNKPKIVTGLLGFTSANATDSLGNSHLRFVEGYILSARVFYILAVVIAGAFVVVLAMRMAPSLARCLSHQHQNKLSAVSVGLFCGWWTLLYTASVMYSFARAPTDGVFRDTDPNTWIIFRADLLSLMFFVAQLVPSRRWVLVTGLFLLCMVAVEIPQTGASSSVNGELVHITMFSEVYHARGVLIGGDFRVETWKHKTLGFSSPNITIDVAGVDVDTPAFLHSHILGARSFYVFGILLLITSAFFSVVKPKSSMKLQAGVYAGAFVCLWACTMLRDTSCPIFSSSPLQLNLLSPLCVSLVLFVFGWHIESDHRTVMGERDNTFSKAALVLAVLLLLLFTIDTPGRVADSDDMYYMSHMFDTVQLHAEAGATPKFVVLGLNFTSGSVWSNTPSDGRWVERAVFDQTSIVAARLFFIFAQLLSIVCVALLVSKAFPTALVPVYASWLCFSALARLLLNASTGADTVLDGGQAVSWDLCLSSILFFGFTFVHDASSLHLPVFLGGASALSAKENAGDEYAMLGGSAELESDQQHQAVGAAVPGYQPPDPVGAPRNPWSQQVDESSGEIFYFNDETGESRWDPPPDL